MKQVMRVFRKQCFQVGDKVLSFFSIIAQLSTVQDVTLSERKVELMFPADDATKAFYQS